MTESALIVSQSGQITHGLVDIVSAQGYEAVTTVETDRPEDGQYYLSPATVEHVERRCESTSGSLAVVVDGVVHPGQVVDLQRQLSLTVRDRRHAVWDHLAEENPVAATLSKLQQARIERREAARTQRESATQSPTGTSGSLAEREEQTQRLQTELDQRQAEARERVRTSYTGVDDRVVLLGRVGAPTTGLWTALTDESATTAVGGPARPRTATMQLGAHTLAVTDTPAILGRGAVPEWTSEAVPGLEVVLEQATCVLGVGDHCEALLSAITERVGVPSRLLESAGADRARDVLGDLLETAEYGLRLPYSDDANAFVSELHDEATVHATEYTDAIYLHVEVARSAVTELRRRTEAVEGEIIAIDTDE